MVRLLLESEALTPKPTDGTKQKRNHTKHGVRFGAESGGLRGAEPRDTTPKYLGVAGAARAPAPQGSGAAGGAGSARSPDRRRRGGGCGQEGGMDGEEREGWRPAAAPPAPAGAPAMSPPFGSCGQEAAFVLEK